MTNKRFKGTMSRLAQYLGAYKVKIILVAIFAVLSTIFTIIGPKVLGNATTAVFNGVLAGRWPAQARLILLYQGGYWASCSFSICFRPCSPI